MCVCVCVCVCVKGELFLFYSVFFCLEGHYVVTFNISYPSSNKNTTRLPSEFIHVCGMLRLSNLDAFPSNISWFRLSEV